MLGLAAFCFMIVVLIGVISALWTIFVGAPWEPMPIKRIHRMLAMANLQPGEVLYDLGSGDGRTLVIAARRFQAKAVGIEIDPLRYIWTQFLITVLGLRKRVRVVWGSFFDTDLSQADVVTMFLTQQTIGRLSNKLQSELNAGTRIVCYEFPHSAWEPEQHDVDSKLFLYRI